MVASYVLMAAVALGLTYATFKLLLPQSFAMANMVGLIGGALLMFRAIGGVGDSTVALVLGCAAHLAMMTTLVLWETSPRRHSKNRRG